MSRLVGAALAAILVAGATAASADVLILRSVGPSANKYRPGQRLPDNARLILRPGDAVSVLRSNGTRVFRGPGTFSVDAAPIRSTRATPESRLLTGVVRGGASPINPARPANLWHVNAGEPGRACIISGSPVTLWRRAANGRGRVSVTTRAGTTTRLNWPAREHMLLLPVGAGAEGSTISYSGPGASREIRITLAELKVDPGNPEMVAPALLASRCRNQLEHFIDLNEEGAS